MVSRLLDDTTKTAIASSIRKRGADTKGLAFRSALQASLLFTLLILGVLMFSVFGDSWAQIGSRLGDFLQGTLRSGAGDDQLGVHQGIYGSLWIAILVAVLAFPLGIAAAIYLEEYAPRTRLTSFIEINIRNLAGVPSVVYGLLGLAILVQGDIFGLDRLTGGRSALSGGIILSLLVLPIVIITAGEAFRAVPSALREGAYGVGATKWDMIRTQVLPYAAPGILTGTLLSMARAVGEAAPLILVGAITGRLGDDPGLLDVGALRDTFTALPIVITTWTQQSGRDVGFTAAAAGAIVVLLVFVLIMNSAAILMRNHFEKKRG
jgi:phosphate transport system permease protein